MSVLGKRRSASDLPMDRAIRQRPERRPVTIRRHAKRKRDDAEDHEPMGKRARHAERLGRLTQQKDACEQRLQVLRHQLQNMQAVSQGRIQKIVEDEEEIRALKRQLKEMLNRTGLYQQQIKQLNDEYNRRIRVLQNENNMYKARMALVNPPRLHY